MKAADIDSRTLEQFFELIRAGLWGRTADAELFRAGADWETICRIGKMQTMSVIMSDGINTLPKELMPPPQIAFKLHSALVGTEQAHKKLNNVLAEVVTLLREQGIESVLLKGQGVAQNYLIPEHRMCGDIDLYVGPKQYERACQVLEGFGEADAESHESESEKHFHFIRKGVTIEIHRCSHVETNPFAHHRYTRWSEALLERRPEEQKESPSDSAGTLRSMQTCGVRVDLPPVEFDTMFIYYHIVNHLIHGGIGLRQLCDWTRYLHTHKEEIEPNMISRTLSTYGSMQTWQILGYIAVNYLGLPADEMPFYSDRYAVKAARCMDIILHKGNFGHYAPESQRDTNIFFVFRKIQSCIITLRSQAALMRIIPADTLAFIPWYLIDGLKRVFTNK